MKNLIVLFTLCIPLGLFAQSSVQKEAVGFISFNEGKVLSLAVKFTDEQYNWRPAEGVRSVQESLLHVAAGNFMFMQVAGFTLPEGLDPWTLEKNVTGKTNVIETVRSSYAFLKDGILKIGNEQLGDVVTFPFPGEYTKLSAIMLGVDHTSEHLGQLIAYARMNGVTPPWSEGGN